MVGHDWRALRNPVKEQDSVSLTRNQVKELALFGLSVAEGITLMAMINNLGRAFGLPDMGEKVFWIGATAGTVAGEAVNHFVLYKLRGRRRR